MTIKVTWQYGNVIYIVRKTLLVTQRSSILKQKSCRPTVWLFSVARPKYQKQRWMLLLTHSTRCINNMKVDSASVKFFSVSSFSGRQLKTDIALVWSNNSRNPLISRGLLSTAPNAEPDIGGALKLGLFNFGEWHDTTVSSPLSPKTLWTVYVLKSRTAPSMQLTAAHRYPNLFKRDDMAHMRVLSKIDSWAYPRAM